MGHPAFIDLNLPPDDLRLLRRLRRTAGDSPSDDELQRLRAAVDELGDELTALRCALDARKVEVLDMADSDEGWKEIAETAWPEEFDSRHSDGR